MPGLPDPHPGPVGLNHITLLFDGDCSFCHACVAWIRARDRHGRVRCVPFQEAGSSGGLPDIPRERLEAAMHVVTAEGGIHAGAAAIPSVLKVLPRWRALAPLFAVPGFPWIADRMYRVVARNRHRLGCGSASCTIGR